MIEMCRRCNGSGHYDEISGTASFHVTCPICGGAGYTGVGSSSKTLLDEFAMAAMGIMAVAMDQGYWTPGDDPNAEIAESSYQMAKAMMKERARRDEMGNVKEDEK